MSVPRMNWKGFISTGVLKPRLDETGMDQPRKAATRSGRKVDVVTTLESFQNYLEEIDRVLPLNDSVIEAVDNQNHPFHVFALNFIDTQLFDSQQLVRDFPQQLSQVKNALTQAVDGVVTGKANKSNIKIDGLEVKKDLNAAKRKVRKLEKQMLYFEQLFAIFNGMPSSRK